MQGLLTFSSDTLSIRPWVDDLIDALGHDPRSHYVEQSSSTAALGSEATNCGNASLMGARTIASAKWS